MEDKDRCPELMKSAYEASWLCAIFQDEKLDRNERIEILKRISKDYLKKKSRIIF